jgi:hypothetical protein
MFAATTSTDGECRGYDDVKKKLVVSLGLFAIITCSVSLGAYAGANLEEVKAYLNKGMILKLNSQPLQVKDSAGKITYPLTYKGTTWLPIRTIGDALNVGIGWDAKTNTIDIKSNSIPTLTTANDIKSYLVSNYSILKTSIGYTSFKFDILEDNSMEYPYDYWVNIIYDNAFFNDLQKSESLTPDQKVIVKNELRIYSEKIGRALTEKVPNHKIKGGYYRFWYEDPAETKLLFNTYYSWSNYDELPDGSHKPFTTIKPSTFRWDELIDSEL